MITVIQILISLVQAILKLMVTILLTAGARLGLVLAGIAVVAAAAGALALAGVSGFGVFRVARNRKKNKPQ